MENARKLLVETLECRMPFAADFATSVDVIAHNSILPADVDGSGAVEVTDALILINTLNRQSTGGTNSEKYFPDVDGDGNIGPTDVLRVVNLLNYQTQASSLVSATAIERTAENEPNETPANAQLSFADPSMIVFVSGLVPNIASNQTDTTAEPETETDETPPERHWGSGFFDPCPGCGLG